jgi:hypothetical protein
LSVNSTVADMLLFVFMGIPMLILSQLVDSFYFIKHLFLWKAAKLTNEKIKSIDYHSFCILENILKTLITEMQEKKMASMEN